MTVHNIKKFIYNDHNGIRTCDLQIAIALCHGEKCILSHTKINSDGILDGLVGVTMKSVTYHIDSSQVVTMSTINSRWVICGSLINCE